MEQGRCALSGPDIVGNLLFLQRVFENIFVAHILRYSEIKSAEGESNTINGRLHKEVHMTYSGRDAAKVAGLVVGGAAIGAALGLLYAPQSGMETRRQIKRYAKRAEVQALRYGREIKAGLAHAVESGKTWLAKKEMRRLTAV